MRASPRGEPADRPRNTWPVRCRLGVVVFAANAARVPPPPPLAGAPLHRDRTRLAGAVSERWNRRFRIPWRAARARFVRWKTIRPPTEHVRAGGLGVVVCAANSRRAPPHAVGRGFSSPSPRDFGGCGFEAPYSKLSGSVTFGSRARRHVENQPTAHGARTARCGVGVVVCAANSHCAPPHAVGRRSSLPTPR